MNWMRRAFVWFLAYYAIVFLGTIVFDLPQGHHLDYDGFVDAFALPIVLPILALALLIALITGHRIIF